MTRPINHSIVVLEIVLFSIAALVATEGALSLVKWRQSAQPSQDAGTILRFPREAVPDSDEQRAGVRNLAPLAKVTVSSTDESSRSTAPGVADGTADQREWASRRQLSGAWILLEWTRPATVTGISLYDRQSPEENVLSGRLIFNDGTMIPVGELPSDGTPWHITFSPRRVRWVEFRIDSAEGRNAGLGEIMVFGKLEE